jgi:hypothetical protein
LHPKKLKIIHNNYFNFQYCNNLSFMVVLSVQIYHKGRNEYVVL